MESTVFTPENGILKKRKLHGCRVDGHVHSLYSGRNPTRYVGTPVTKLLGVRESYAAPRKIHSVMKKRGLGFCTLSDHDSVLGALEMRRIHPEDTFVSCEYTVRVNAGEKGQAVHAGVWGLDYPGGTSEALPDPLVLELHQELLAHARLGYERFVSFCEQAGLGFCLNHPAWQGTPKRPLSGGQIDEITDAFPVLEVNGDCQLENLFAIEVALSKGKALCAGTDAHNPLRIGNQFTAPLRPVADMSDFLRAFREGEIGIGSDADLPDGEEEPSAGDIVRHMFNGTIFNLRKDTYRGVLDYLFSSQERGARKAGTLVFALGIPAALSSNLGPEFTLPTLFALEGLVLASVPYVMPRIERINSAKKTRKLYLDYQRHLSERRTRALREEISRLQGDLDQLSQRHKARQLPELIARANWWDRVLLKLLGGFKSFHNDYDMSSTDVAAP